MEETKKTSHPSQNASADKAANSGSPKDLPEKTTGDGPPADSGPHVNIQLSEEEVAEINEIFKGTAFFEDSPTPLPTKSSPLRGSAPVFVPNSGNTNLHKWQTMKFISAGNLKTIKDTQRSLPPFPSPPDENTTSSKRGEQEFNQRRESFNSVPPPADLFAIPKTQQRQADSGSGKRHRRNSKANKNKKVESKKPEGRAVGGTSGFTDPFPLKFNPLTSRVMDMNAAEDFTCCSEKCGQCGHCAESFNYRMYVAD